MGKRTLAAAGLLALGATALSSCGPDVPPHEVRIEYLKRELYPNGSINFMGLGYFNLTNISMVDGWDLSATYTKPGLTSLRLIGGLDRDGTDNSVFDELLVLELTLDGKRGCELQRSDVPEGLREKVDEQYERTTESGYIARAYHRKAFSGVLGKEVFEELLGLCSADDEIPAYVLDMIPDSEDINPDLLEILKEGE